VLRIEPDRISRIVAKLRVNTTNASSSSSSVNPRPVRRDGIEEACLMFTSILYFFDGCLAGQPGNVDLVDPAVCFKPYVATC